jgi:hypothetical protein
VVRSRPAASVGQIKRLKEQVGQLKEAIGHAGTADVELTAFRVQVVSQLAAQYEEIIRLRAAEVASGGWLSSVIVTPSGP